MRCRVIAMCEGLISFLDIDLFVKRVVGGQWARMIAVAWRMITGTFIKISIWTRCVAVRCLFQTWNQFIKKRLLCFFNNFDAG